MGTLTAVSKALQGFATRWLLTDGTNEVVFDVTNSWGKTMPGQIAEHAVEEGVDLTDHVKRGNRELRLGVMLVQETGPGGAIIGLGLSGLFQTDPNVRAEQLESWWEKGAVLTLDGKETVENVMIESLSTSREAETADARVYDLTLKQIRIADTDAVSLGGAGTRDQETETIS